MPRSRSLTRLTMRVGLLHLGQSVDFVVSITFWRSPVFAIFAMGWLVLLLGLSLHTRTVGVPIRQFPGLWFDEGRVAASTARSWRSARSYGNKRERDSLLPVYIRARLSTGALDCGKSSGISWAWSRVGSAADPRAQVQGRRRADSSCPRGGACAGGARHHDSRQPSA